MSIDINSIVIFSIHGADFHYIIIIGITKSETINVLRNADLSEKHGSLQIITFHCI